jgi:hypothetical protein
MQICRIHNCFIYSIRYNHGWTISIYYYDLKIFKLFKSEILQINWIHTIDLDEIKNNLNNLYTKWKNNSQETLEYELPQKYKNYFKSLEREEKIKIITDGN